MPAGANRTSRSRAAEFGQPGGIVALAGWSTDGHRLALWRDPRTGQSQVVELDWFEGQFRQSGSGKVESPVEQTASGETKLRKAPRRLVALFAGPPATAVRR